MKIILRVICVVCSIGACGVMSFLSAQIRPPGYEREVEAMNERMRTNVLDQDSVTIVDTITLYDPDTFRDTVQVVTSTISWRDYMTLRLGIQNPDILLNGEPYTVTDLRTYEPLVVRWNAGASKIDTLRQD